MEDGPQRTERAIAARSTSAIPPAGEWPCQALPEGDLPVRAVAFMYRLLRDGATGPGDVEGHLLQARLHDGEGDPLYTNCHLEMLARAHVTWLLGGPRTEPRDQEPPAIALVIGATDIQSVDAETVDGADIVIGGKGADIGILKGDARLSVSRVV